MSDNALHNGIVLGCAIYALLLAVAGWLVAGWLR